MSQRRRVGKKKMAHRGAIPAADSSERKNLSREHTSQGEKLAHRENLSREIIAYLSKEIETTSNSMMGFRSKVGSALFTVPFLLLGSLVSAMHGVSISIHLGAIEWVAITIVCLCAFALAFVSGRIEEDGWRQCNLWRKLISELQKDPTVEINERNVRKDSLGVDPVDWVKWSYLLAFMLLLVTFLCSLFILSRVRTTPAPTVPPAASAPGPPEELRKP